MRKPVLIVIAGPNGSGKNARSDYKSHLLHAYKSKHYLHISQ